MDNQAPLPNDPEGWEETQYESLDWGGDEESSNRLVELYPSTSKPAQAALALLVAGFILLLTAMTLNGILSDDEKVAGSTIKSNEMMNEMGLEIDGGELDDDFVRQVLRGALFYELICAVLAFWGSVELWRKQNYNVVLLGCAAAIIGLGSLLLSTLAGAFALYLTFQSKPEFGINEQDESW
tara:strand:+ start:670 stop:1215 length:546 start_codon:yes stop_codon:yes gene_type:complete